MNTPDVIHIKTALVSVSDKSHLIPFVKKLDSFGVKIISTGGTAKSLSEAAIKVIPVEQVTGFPEMMDGRVKTLHPKIHGGLLALRDKPSHAHALNQHDILPIDLVCVNLYPFEKVTADENVAYEDAIENIDIGGPSMLRSAAKNHAYVTCVSSPDQYENIGEELEKNEGATTLELRRKLAQAAFARTAEYDTAISKWMQQRK